MTSNFLTSYAPFYAPDALPRLPDSLRTLTHYCPYWLTTHLVFIDYAPDFLLQLPWLRTRTCSARSLTYLLRTRTHAPCSDSFPWLRTFLTTHLTDSDYAPSWLRTCFYTSLWRTYGRTRLYVCLDFSFSPVPARFGALDKDDCDSLRYSTTHYSYNARLTTYAALASTFTHRLLFDIVLIWLHLTAKLLDVDTRRTSFIRFLTGIVIVFVLVSTTKRTTRWW